MAKSLKAHYHLPGLFEFHDFYRLFLPLYRKHPEYFYSWCDIGSIYGAPMDCLWGGGRTSFGDADPKEVYSFMKEYGISARLTLSNSLLREEHLSDAKCNALCTLFSQGDISNGVIVTSDILAKYLQKRYPDLYLVSSTTKVLTRFEDFKKELDRPEFSYVVPDFRLNKRRKELDSLSLEEKEKAEFLCNECCDPSCLERKACYENVSRKNLGEDVKDFPCPGLKGSEGYRFSAAKKNPMFIGIEDIQNVYLPMNFSNFKIEGRGLGSALLLEFILYYMVKPEHQLEVREAIYLDNMLDLF